MKTATLDQLIAALQEARNQTSGDTRVYIEMLGHEYDSSSDLKVVRQQSSPDGFLFRMSKVVLPMKEEQS